MKQEGALTDPRTCPTCNFELSPDDGHCRRCEFRKDIKVLKDWYWARLPRYEEGPQVSKGITEMLR